MEMFENKKKGLYLGASIMVLVYAIYKLVELLLYFDFKYLVSYLPSFILYVALIVLGVLLIKKKNTLVVSIMIGVVTLVEGYWFVRGIINYIKYEHFSFFNLILDILRVSGPVFLTLISFADAKNKWPKLRNLWFVPMIASSAYLILFLLFYVVNYFGYDLANIFNSVAIEIFYLGGLVVYSLTLGNVEKITNLFKKLG